MKDVIRGSAVHTMQPTVNRRSGKIVDFSSRIPRLKVKHQQPTAIHYNCYNNIIIIIIIINHHITTIRKLGKMPIRPIRTFAPK
jgi:hypothetical protein